MNLPWRKWRASSVILQSILQRNLVTSSYVCAKKKNQKPLVMSKTKPKIAPFSVWNDITVKELAEVSKRSIDDVFEATFHTDVAVPYEREDDRIQRNDLTKILKILGLRARFGPAPVNAANETLKRKEQTLDAVKQPPPPREQLKPRRPVVTVMGHVDHGKTTLLDTLRKSNTVDQEHGGITQHIGAFTVKAPQYKLGAVTFLDTPGHAAFSAMRARGANVTDMVVLVVAADDGVMEQTIESINFAKQAQVPIIVAVNKMDKPAANPQKAKDGLLACGIQSDDHGGDVQFIPISGLKGEGLDNLLEAIVFQSELIGLEATYEGLAEGYVIESCVHEHRGKLCTLLVKRGVIRKGSFVIAGAAWCKVRTIFDEWGQMQTEIAPGCAAQVTGWRALPNAGDLVLEVENEDRAKEVVDVRERLSKAKKLEDEAKVIDGKMAKDREVYRAQLESRWASGLIYTRRRTSSRNKETVEDTHPTLRVVIKGDTDGSVETLLDILDTYDQDEECRLNIVHYGVGPVSMSDIELAELFNGIVYALHVGVLPEAKTMAKKTNVKQFKVIYKLVESLKEDIGERLPHADAEEVIGQAKVQQEFLITEQKKKIPVAGARCMSGELHKTALFKLVRDGEELHCGPLVSLKHLKNEVKSIRANVECGLMFENPSIRFKENDVISCIRKYKVKQKTGWSPRGF